MAVLVRDDFTCRHCGKRGGRLEVHHIKAWGPYPHLRYRASNGLTLCRPCHNQTKKSPRPVTVGPRTLAALVSSRGEL
ncbi:MAG: HNH endonuclease [Acidobacteria bacterium]|nr:HNH endonuclease [Acidobacteriota bacterium]